MALQALEHTSTTEEPSLKLLRRLLLLVSFLVMAVGVACIVLTQDSISHGIKETSIIQRGADRMEGSQVWRYGCCSRSDSVFSSEACAYAHCA